MLILVLVLCTIFLHYTKYTLYTYFQEHECDQGLNTEDTYFISSTWLCIYAKHDTRF